MAPESFTTLAHLSSSARMYASNRSMADEVLTRDLKQALALVDVKVLDHFVVAGTQAMSFAERGLL